MSLLIVVYIRVILLVIIWLVIDVVLKNNGLKVLSVVLGNRVSLELDQQSVSQSVCMSVSTFFDILVVLTSALAWHMNHLRSLQERSGADCWR